LTQAQLQSLATFAIKAREKRLPAEVEQETIQKIIDWGAATIVGAREPASQLLTKALVDGSTSGKIQLLTSSANTDVRTAALINGTAAHVSEIDDIYRDGLYHPGAPTVAAAIAMAEKVGASGNDLIRAVAIGYEIGCRISKAVNPKHYKYWHTTGTVGAIGSAAAAAEILKLDAEQFAHALATSVTMAAALQQAFRTESMSKPLHSGRAAEGGVLSALMAAEGMTGSVDILDGESGFGVAMGEGVPTDEILKGLGITWCISEITVKNHFCCGHNFAAIDAGLVIRAAGVLPENISKIEIETYTIATEVARNLNPHTAFEAKFSLPYTVATGICTGSVREKAFTDDALKNSEVRRLLGVTTVKGDAKMDAVYPLHRMARVTVTEKNGTVHVEERSTRKGDPDDPLSVAEISDKFNELVEPRLGKERTAALLSNLNNLRTLENVKNLNWGAK
jgi:2-methylcitrate dehydratase PrpD